MQEKCNLVMAIGSILNPRKKITSLEFAFNSLYSTSMVVENRRKVREILRNIFNEYMVLNNVEPSLRRNSSSAGHNLPSSSQTCSFDETTDQPTNIQSAWSKFENFVKEKATIEPEKSKLEIYLEDEKLVRINSLSRSTYFKKKSKKLNDICSEQLWRNRRFLHRYIILFYLEGWPP
ncbi:hypothetical protein LIER_21217 [Lithospermum erythrorhizon]|uniref:hAT-like transposase RNase-H fold domain-containing protein n=1 Tax=Lithospermum erythrorhizon TaxID=34254 RepID=A0AAV3QTL8_LITER